MTQLETLARIGDKKIAALRMKAIAPGALDSHPNFHIREIATSPQARASEMAMKGVGQKWQEILVKEELPYDVILDRQPLDHRGREDYRDSATVYCLEADLEKVSAAAVKVPRENEWGVIIYQRPWQISVLVEGEMVGTGHRAVELYSLWQYPARTK